MRRIVHLIIAAELISAVAPRSAAWAKVYSTVPEFLDRITGTGVPDSQASCQRQKETHYLTDEQKKRILAGWNRPAEEMKALSGLWVRYRLSCAGRDDRFVYFDSHRVRTQGETLAIVVQSGGALDQVEVLSFDEPQDYIPKDKWFGIFTAKRLSPALELQRDIPMITGATLSARAAVVSARKVLAVHSVLAVQ